jgi:hypothetical protein
MSRNRTPFVAQISNLLYRRFQTCDAPEVLRVSDSAESRPPANRRYSRFQICATDEPA